MCYPPVNMGYLQLTHITPPFDPTEHNYPKLAPIIIMSL